MNAAIRACDPAALLSRAIGAHPLPRQTTVNVIAAGKAASRMAHAFAELHDSKRTGDIVIARGGHPLPDEESFAAGAAALRLADTNRERAELLVVLLSGGASAMMAAPAPGVTLEDKIALTRELLQSGLPIAEMNARRKRLSAIKGGKLAIRAGRSITYAISDVHAPIEDDPAVIGSGPTVLPDHGDAGRRPGHRTETTFVLAGSRRDAMKGAAEEAERLGYDVRVIDPPTLGEAREAAKRLAIRIDGYAARGLRAGRPMVVIASGETTVTLPRGSDGRGGRNQEFALAAALAIADHASPARTFASATWALASVGTDGIDGPTDAAGAIVDNVTLARAQEKGLDARAALQAHDAYSFFAKLGDLILTGPTGTNVGDLQVCAISRSSP